VTWQALSGRPDVAGDAAEAFETETDESGAAGVMQVLREIFSAQGVAVPDPVVGRCRLNR